MDLDRTTTILRALSRGEDPRSGARLPEDSVLHDVEVARALFEVMDILEGRNIPKSKTHVRTGESWGRSEEEQLLRELGQGATIGELARRLGRSRSAIESRLRVLHTRRANAKRPKMSPKPVSKPSRRGKPWTREEIVRLIEGRNEGKSPETLAKELERGVEGVRVKLLKVTRSLPDREPGLLEIVRGPKWRA